MVTFELMVEGAPQRCCGDWRETSAAASTTARTIRPCLALIEISYLAAIRT
jgi:hypothetical protein